MDDTAKVKGQFISPAQAAEVLATFPEVRAWQLVVENPDGADRLVLCLCGQEDLPEGSPRLVDARVFD